MARVKIMLSLRRQPPRQRRQQHRKRLSRLYRPRARATTTDTLDIKRLMWNGRLTLITAAVRRPPKLVLPKKPSKTMLLRRSKKTIYPTTTLKPYPRLRRPKKTTSIRRRRFINKRNVLPHTPAGFFCTPDHIYWPSNMLFTLYPPVTLMPHTSSLTHVSSIWIESLKFTTSLLRKLFHS